MSLSPGTRIGPYEVIGMLGAGGMGQVYRGRDARLLRDVALKILPPAFAADPERVARFEREAQLLAQLGHSNIGAIYGVEEVNGAGARSLALVLELIEGETLANRLERGRLPVEQALAIARQIADAVEAAHDRGIIHRDLKPSNIKITSGGTVKVLDFGLAKLHLRSTDNAALFDSSPRGTLTVDDPASPTMLSPATVTGVGIILGTAAYMSPEQARGQPPDSRSDIWSFGCILYEMLTGKPPFDGSGVSEMIAAVLTRDPDWALLPASTPAATRRLLRRCLERDVKKRLHHIADARLELDDVDVATAPSQIPRRRRNAAMLAALVLVASAISGALIWNKRGAEPRAHRKFEITPALAGAAAPENVSPFEIAVRLSPDGSHAAYIGGGHLWVVDLDRTGPRDLGPLPDGSFTLAWSPDSAFIGFASADRKYRKISLSGGPPVVVCDLPATGRITGAAWPTADTIVLAAWRDSLYKVAARGGTPELWLKVDATKEIDFHGPEPLPDGRVMFRTHTRGTGANEVSLAEVFDGTTRSVLLREDGIGSIAFAPPGYLLFVRPTGGGSLWAVPFDSAPLDTSKAFLVDAHAEAISAASDGTLLISTADANSVNRLVRVDRAGRDIEDLVAAAPDVSYPVFSPDGHKLAYHTHIDGNPDVWVQDLQRKLANRLTFEPGEDVPTAWSPDGRDIIYTRHSDEVEGSEIASVAADGSGTPRPLVKGRNGILSTDGRYLLFVVDERGALRLRYAERRGDGALGAPQRVIHTEPEPNQVIAATVSPDGRLLAYAERGPAGEGGLFVTRFPSGEGRWQVAGAPVATRTVLWTAWSRLSKELFFLNPGNDRDTFELRAVAVSEDSGVGLAPSVMLFKVDAATAALGFDAAPDGKSFVLRRDAGRASGGPAVHTRFTLVENWFSEFAARAKQ
jgi:serine/threonine-protein kinase